MRKLKYLNEDYNLHLYKKDIENKNDTPEMEHIAILTAKRTGQQQYLDVNFDYELTSSVLTDEDIKTYFQEENKKSSL